MSITLAAANPFQSLIDPASIVEHIERSEALNSLSRRFCRPLDKPLIPLRPGIAANAAVFDAAIDDEDDHMVGDWNDSNTAFGTADFVDTAR